MSYPLIVRISKWDGSGGPPGVWDTTWEVDQSAIVSARCSFFGYRIERDASISVSDTGRVWDARLQNVLEDLRENTGPLYRLDIFADDVRSIDPAYPSGYNDLMIYWSGILTRLNREDDDSGRRSARLEAVGWSAQLGSINTRRQVGKPGDTIDDVIDAAVNDSAMFFPGTLTRVADDASSSIYWQTWGEITAVRSESLRDFLNRAKAKGNFTFGISVSGYPTLESNEFRLVFAEARAELDPAEPSGGMDPFIGMTFHREDPRVSEVVIPRRDERYTNIWDVYGASIERIGPDMILGGQVADAVSIRSFGLGYKTPSRGGHEVEIQNFVGLGLKVLGLWCRVRLNESTLDEDDDQEWSDALVALPQKFLDANDGSDTWIIAGAEFEPSGFEDQAMKFTVTPKFPCSQVGDGHCVNPDIDNMGTESDGVGGCNDPMVAVRIVSNGVPIHRIVRRDDETDNDIDVSYAPETMTTRKVLVDNSVIGEAQAGPLAMKDSSAERRNSRTLTFRYVGLRQVPGDNSRNNVCFLSGATTRITRVGSVVGGGDGYDVADDPDRVLGGGIILELQNVNLSWTRDGWVADFSLGGAAEELSAVLAAEGIGA